MIKQFSHTVLGIESLDPAAITLALEVAHKLHAPATRAPEVTAVPEMMGLRLPATRPHRRKVPLRRLSTLRA